MTIINYWIAQSKWERQSIDCIWCYDCWYSNKNLNPIVTDFFIRRGKGHNFGFYCTFYFVIPKNIRLNFPHYFIMKIPNKWELQQIAFNHSSDINFQDFKNL